MMKYILWSSVLIAAAVVIIAGCERKAIDSLYTNPDAIVDLLKTDDAAEEAADFDFIDTSSYFNLIAALPGDIGTIEYKLGIDSSRTSYDVTVGDTVDIGSLRAKEANASSEYKIYYRLTLRDATGNSVVKHLTTNTSSARKRHYLLQLGSFSSPLRGWVFWGTTAILNLGKEIPDVSWSSFRQGELPNTDGTIMRNEYPIFTPGERITVQYRGLSTDLVFLNINENGTPQRIRFTRMNDVVQEANWSVSADYGGKDYYYYAGVEIYPRTTLSSSDSTETGFSYLGLMYRIEGE
jgi:hypothetical protein